MNENEGESIRAEHLFSAYTQGYFPWPTSCEDVELHEIPWCSPDPRGVLLLEDLKINKSLKKILTKLDRNNWKITLNENFPEIIRTCASIRAEDTWLTPSLIKAYEELFTHGYAYSVGVWEEQELIGGVYGVQIGRYVSGESMFYKRPNASKVALVYLLQLLKERDIPFLDTQMVTPVVASLGGKLIKKALFDKMLADVLPEDLKQK